MSSHAASIVVNGVEHSADVQSGTSLLDILRSDLGLTGTKPACGMGECGACTVLISGRPALACLTLAVRVSGPVTTVEGLGPAADALRSAFADYGAFQCGYCTPGQIVHGYALMQDTPSREEVRAALSGNICRCTGYQSIVEAVLHASSEYRVPPQSSDAPRVSDE